MRSASILARAALALALSGAGPVMGGESEGLVDGLAYTEAVRRVEIEPGRRLNLYCVGSGSPVVMFESGLTDPINVWGLIQPQVGRETTACAYDRAGVGFSDALVRPANAANMVDDLRKLLDAAGLQAPFVLVAHSSGGMNARLFAYTYPEDVAGLVLVDPSHEDQTEGFRSLDPRGRSAAQWDAQVIEPSIALRRECIAAIDAGIQPGSAIYRKCSFPQYRQLSAAVQQATEKFQMTPAFQRAQLSEEENVFRASVEQLKAARRSLGSIPVRVLSKDRPPPPKEPLTDEQMALREARYQLWLRLGRDSAAISQRGEARVVAGAGHGIPLEQPQAVISAVREVMLAAKAETSPQ